jgi:hypothetical protein
VFIQQWLIGLAMMVLGITTVPSVVFGEEANPEPTKEVPVALPVEISIDIVTGDEEDALPKPEITIHMYNAKSDKAVNLDLPMTNAPPDHPSSAAAHAPFDTPPVETPFDAPPVTTPPLDVPVTDFPPIEPPTVGAPPVGTPPVDLPAAGRP